MGVLPGIFGFPGKPRVAEVGAVVVGALAQFVTRAGKIAASLVTVDSSGNVATPGRADIAQGADGSARVSASGSGATHTVTFGHSSAAYPAVSQQQNGFVGINGGMVAIGGGAAGRCATSGATAENRGLRVSGPLDTSLGPAVSVALHVAGGFFMLPQLSESDRDSLLAALAAAVPGGDFRGLQCFNTTADRAEMYDGAAWVGLTTEA